MSALCSYNKLEGAFSSRFLWHLSSYCSSHWLIDSWIVYKCYCLLHVEFRWWTLFAKGKLADPIFACLNYFQKQASTKSRTKVLTWTQKKRVQIWRFPGHRHYSSGVDNRQKATVKWTWSTWQLHGEMAWHFVQLYTISDRIWCKFKLSQVVLHFTVFAPSRRKCGIVQLIC